MKRLEQLCHQYTNLSESDIKELQRTARYLSSTTLYQLSLIHIFDATGQLAEKFGINKLPANELFKTQYMISVK